MVAICVTNARQLVMIDMSHKEEINVQPVQIRELIQLSLLDFL